MKTSWAGLAACFAAVLGSAAGQNAESERVAPSHALRQIEDRSTGTVWLLLADPAHPGGPGRLVRSGESGKAGRPAGKASRPASRPLLIRAGERVAVEEHSAVVDVVLEAVAMEPARAGEMFRVRLKAGSRVLRVVAASPGRAVMAVEGGR